MREHRRGQSNRDRGWSLVTAGSDTTHSLRTGENKNQTQDKGGATELCGDP